ncbi:MAG: biotin--[acetyl-CoA-carboxylase] ligase [Bacteroidota bacterium]
MSSLSDQFHILPSVDSTNNYAMAKAHAGMAKSGDCYFTPLQINGKGQMGKQWLSGENENIALSIVVAPDGLKIPDQFYLSAVVSIACLDFFTAYAGDETKIKWPNDIYWRDRKAGGILIENVFKGKDWLWSVIGIGLNLNQGAFDDQLKNPVSLKQITGKNFDTVELARQLHLKVYNAIIELKANSFETVLERYNSLLFKLNERVKLKKGTAVFETVIKGVNEQGQLLTMDTLPQEFNFGEVSWVL